MVSPALPPTLGAAGSEVRAASAQNAATASAGDSDEASLVQAARSGDRAAFARLHQRYAPMVHGIALARVPASDAADIVQEVFVHAIDRLPMLRDNDSFGPWLAAITRNMAIEFHRRQRARLHQVLPDNIMQQATLTHPIGEIEHAQRLLGVMRSMPESYAETLVLRLVEGLTGPQIAACTGMTHGSVRVNLTRGMAMLRERLSELNLTMEDSP